jgi:hypothetical protein
MNTRIAVLSVAVCLLIPALASASPGEPAPTPCGIVLAPESDGRPLEHVAVPTHEPGPADEDRGLSMKGRTRVEVFGGLSDSYLEDDDRRLQLGGGQGGLALSHWLREDLSLELQFQATDLDVVHIGDIPWDSTETRGSLGLLAGARYYLPKATFGGAFRPYVAGAIGSFSEYYAFSSDRHTDVHRRNTRFGGQAGGGVDFRLNSLLSLGLKLAVTFRDGHDPSFASTFGVGFAWGRARGFRSASTR